MLVALAVGVAAAIALAMLSPSVATTAPAQRCRCCWPRWSWWSALPLVVFVLAGFRSRSSVPQLGRFNVSGGVEILPEFAALLLALSVYTAAFIAEVVRAGMLSVSRGQIEAAHALGLRRGMTLRLIVLPQAMRVIIPPLTSQYLNLIKNSSLAVAIGYPDLVQVFAGTVLDHHRPGGRGRSPSPWRSILHQPVVSLLMNLYARRIAIAER